VISEQDEEACEGLLVAVSGHVVADLVLRRGVASGEARKQQHAALTGGAAASAGAGAGFVGSGKDSKRWDRGHVRMSVVHSAVHGHARACNCYASVITGTFRLRPYGRWESTTTVAGVAGTGRWPREVRDCLNRARGAGALKGPSSACRSLIIL
jgi:hypothetical protein